MSLTVLQSEVDMAGRRMTAVGDLAFNPQIGIVGLHVLTDIGDERTHTPDAAIDRASAGSELAYVETFWS